MSSPTRVLVWALAFEGGLGLVALILGRLTGVDPLATLRPQWRAAGAGALAALPLFAGFVYVTTRPPGPFRPIREFLEEVVRPLFGPLGVVALAALSAAAGLGEELLFRGFLQQWLSGWLTAPAALALASLLFGLAHAITFTYAVVAGAMGLLFGWLWQWSDNLICPVVAHGLYDFLALTYFLKNRRLTKFN